MRLSKLAPLGVCALLMTMAWTAHGQNWADEATFGPEFEFTNAQLQALPSSMGSRHQAAESAAAQTLRLHLDQLCQSMNCTVTSVPGKWQSDERVYEIETTVGPVRVQISTDPRVVEITVSPLTLKQMIVLEPLLQSFIFQGAADMGLTPSPRSSGHVSLGAHIFHEDPELFLRLFVDQTNHPEWNLGLLGNDPYGAPPLSLLSPNQRSNMKNVVRDFYRGRFQSLRDVALAIDKKVYYRTTMWNDFPKHYQAQGLKTITGQANRFSRSPPAPLARQRVEYRGIRAQSSYAQFIGHARFILGRFDLVYHEKLNQTPIVYQGSDRNSFEPQELVQLFDDEIVRMNLGYQDFQFLLPAELQKLKPGRSCGGFFGG